MKTLIDGAWVDRSAEVHSTDGSFIRKDTAFRNWITADGAPGPSGDGGFKAESGRYHLYVSYACPWAHRTLIFRELKGLEAHVSVSVVHPLMYEMGWELPTLTRALQVTRCSVRWRFMRSISQRTRR